MRHVLTFLSAFGLMAATPLAAAADGNGAPLRLAQSEAKDDDPAATREEIRERRRELREKERELRELEREQRDERRERIREALRPRFWAGVGAGVGWGAVDVTCRSTPFGDDCREEGQLRTYSANVTVSTRRTALRLRGIRDADKGDDRRTPYETAVLVGNRFGHSNWYGLAGYGRVRHPADDFRKDHASGFAWEIVFAPSSKGLTGLELSFQGQAGRDVDFVGFTAALRLGLLE